MIFQTKPRLAKYGFEIKMASDILSYGEKLAKIHKILEYIPEEVKGRYWLVTRNSMGTISVTIYINDIELYHQIEPIVNAPKKLKVGDKVFVFNENHCYATFASWVFLDKVPEFEQGAHPEQREYTITFIAPHSPNDEQYRDDLIYVLDNKYMMDAPGFSKD